MTHTRREFTKLSAALSSGVLMSSLMSSCKTNSIGSAIDYRKNIGIQLWTVRRLLQKDHASTLKAVADAGFAHVELMGTDQLTTFADALKETGLGVRSSHISYSNVKNNMEGDKVIESAVNNGLSDLCLGYLASDDRQSIDDYKRACEALNRYGEQCKKAGLHLSYHNHSFEFLPIDGTNGWNTMKAELDENLVSFELDTYWVSIAGHDPLSVMADLGKRVHLLHLKDKKSGVPNNYSEGDVPKDSFKELGNGVLDFKKILAAGAAAGVPYCMIEQDESPDPIQSINTSIHYLEKII